ncbi:RHS repeat-associated core domain protein [Xenococcus sp. PCC 7305]|uniref:SdrD B-like domain-containing protein n=1 Tax=Xenococcus sp. PCC 7305 TaxID=102125 RepID=UPI0002AC573A|nr:SdrD B-like domain-containing protein [Xenococcus sp. PCC 7305]ELS01946.1 RHS repeat-associated core domain protein [Xenococcus sp. PCC 7305]
MSTNDFHPLVDGTVLAGNKNSNILVGTEFNDQLFGLGGNDALVGQNGQDLLLGAIGNDALYGLDGGDKLDGGQGNDNLLGGPNSDWLFGRLGDDVLWGEDGDDDLSGGKGTDILNAGPGDDFVNGGIGNDYLLLKGGSDTVVLGPGNGFDIVLDYHDGQDKIQINQLNFHQLEISPLGHKGTLISVDDPGSHFDGETLALLRNVDPHLLDIDDFIFNQGPTITSENFNEVPENETAAIDVNAIDDFDGEGSGLTFSLTGGTDKEQFEIDSRTGEVSFKEAPDFENPGDADGDNNYHIRGKVTDYGGLKDVQDITITVTDVNEAEVTAALMNDTGIDGDGITIDPTVAGEIISSEDGEVIPPEEIVSLMGRLNGGEYIDISTALIGDGTFKIFEEFEALSDGNLPDGDYTLGLKATNVSGEDTPEFIVSFTLDRTPPEITFDLAPESDTGEVGDMITTERLVNLVGQTDPNLQVTLVQTGEITTADENGDFTFTDVPLQSAGTRPFTVIAVDDAGNQGRFTKDITRVGVNGAPTITSTPETVFEPETEDSYRYQVQAVDPDEDNLNYILLDAPDGASINENGAIIFTPEGTIQPSYPFTVQVDDGRGGTDVQEFAVEVPGVGGTGIIRGIKWNDLNGNGDRDDSEPGLAGVTVYLDSNNNGVLDLEEPTQVTAEDDPTTTDIDETGQYEFNNLPADTYIVREVVPVGFEQTFPSSLTAPTGDGFADVVLEFFDSGVGPIPGPYGSPPGTTRFNIPVSTDVVLGPPFRPRTDLSGDFLSLPTGTFITVGFTDEVVIDGPGDDIFIESLFDSAGEFAEISVSADGNEFVVLETIGQGGSQGVDLADINFTEPVVAVRIEGLDNRGSAPGYDLVSVEVLPGSIANPDFYTVELEEGEVVENIDFGNTQVASGIIRGIKWDDLNGNGDRDDSEPGLAGVTVYLDSNKNGVLDPGEPVQITAEDDPTTPNIDEVGQYEFNNLADGIYDVREIAPEGFEQTFPVDREGTTGDGFADVVLEYFDSGSGPITGPYGFDGVNGNVPVSVDVVLGNNNQSLALPTDSFVTVGFTDEIIIDGPGNDIFVSELGAAGDRAEVFVSSDLENFTFIGIGNGGNTSVFDLSSIEFTEPVRAVKVVGLDNRGSVPGFDLLSVQGLPESITNPDFYTVDLAQGEVVENIDFGNAQVASGIIRGTKWEDLDGDGERDDAEPGLGGVTVYLDLNNNGILEADHGEPIQVTANDDPDTPNIDETGQYEFRDLEAGNYIVREVVPDGFEQTFPLGSSTQIGDGFADVVLDFFDSTGEGPIGGGDNIPLESPVDTSVVLGSDEENKDFLILRKDSSITVGFTDEVVVDGEGDDIFIAEEIPRDEQAEVFVSSDEENFVSLGIADGGTTTALDLAAISFTEPVRAVKIVALNDGSGTPGFELLNVQVLPNSIANPGFYNIELAEGEVATDIDFGNVLTDLNLNFDPEILSEPITTAFEGIPYQYNVAAVDRNRDELTYSLPTAPDGMEINEDTGVITWDTGAVDNYEVVVQVDDGRGGVVTQTYNLEVVAAPVDDIPPDVSLGFSGTVFNIGDTINLQIAATDDTGLSDLDLAFDGNSLPLTPDIADIGVINTSSVNFTEPGVFDIVASATDLGGNSDTETLSIRVLDPDDTEAPEVEIDVSEFDPFDLVIREKTNIVGTVSDENLEFYRVEIAPVSLIDLNNPAAPNPAYITVGEGTDNIENGVLACLDPNLYANDNYFLRVLVQDINGNVNVEGFGVGINSQNKPGEFSLEFTDLSIPVAGIPIEVTRNYSSLESNILGDFGFGWTLGLGDPRIVESAPSGVDLTQDDFFGGNSFTQGTRVELTTPDGRRVGFTFEPVPNGGSFLGARFAPSFVPDPGVNETLTVPDFPLSLNGDGSVGLYLFGFTYNPSEYTLTAKDGTEYQYSQNVGLQTVTDRNGNVLTITDDGVTSSTGVGIEFVRDDQGLITEIIDPEGESIEYRRDANNDLVGVSDREENETTHKYESDRAHYLTELIDPLGRIGVRTEYDENGQISKIFDADGNALDIDYDSASSTQTITDPFDNKTTFIFDDRGNIISEINALGGLTTLTYDDKNNLKSETDPEGDTISYSYDDKGNVLTETDGEGNTTTFTYNANNDILTETNALGNVTTNTYDANGNLKTREDAEGNVTTYGYGLYSLLTSITDAEGNEGTFAYDGRGYLTQLNYPSGAKFTFTYDNNGNVRTLINDLNQAVTFTYDNEGRGISVTNPEGNTSFTKYNSFGDTIAEIDELGRRTEFVYNDRGLLIATIYPDATSGNLDDNPRIINEYDESDRLIATRDELERFTYYEYDALSRLEKTIYPDATPDNLDDNPFILTEYYADGLVAAEIDELGNRTEFEYDKAGNVVIQRDALGNETIFEYDAVGNLKAMINPNGNRTEYSYDGLGQLIEIEYADGTVEQQIYNSLGYLIEVIDQAGVSTNYEYDALGALTKVIDALGGETEYIRDTEANIIQQINANGNIINFTYDDLNQVATNTLPLGQIATTTYDAVGNIATTNDFNGVVTTYTYDERDRLIARSYSDRTPTETFTYTLTGELETVTDNRGTTTHEYDERDRLISRTEPDGRKIEYTYDAAGNILTLSTDSGVTEYTYDVLNRIDTVTDPDDGVTDYDYDPVGNLITTSFPNGVVENRDYDSLNRLIELENVNGSVISSFSYTLDEVGNRIRIEEEDGRVVEYEYDVLNRLTEESVTDAVNGNFIVEYVYDAVGNRLQKDDSVNGLTTYNYDDNDRLISETTNNVVTQYEYDDEGNLITKRIDSENQTTYEWNAKGELTAVEATENGSTGRVEYEYDHDSIRVAINIDGAETRFLIDKHQQQFAQVIEEYLTSGEGNKSYVHGWDLISQDDGTERVYYHVDGLGSTRNITDVNGGVVVEYTFDAYGNLINQVGDTENNYLFTGEQFDNEIGLNYNRARYYDPNTGRFISRDFFDGFNDQPSTLQDYLYAIANPANYTDPSGEIVNITYARLSLQGIVFYSFLQAAFIDSVIPNCGPDYLSEFLGQVAYLTLRNTLLFFAIITGAGFWGGFGWFNVLDACVDGNPSE